jgi:hypothetical protein
MMDNQEDALQRFAVHSDDVRESFKLAFESVKHQTTLSAGTLALFATFLDRIFPQELDREIKVLIALSFAAFILSLVLAALSMWRIAGLVRSRRGYESKKRRLRWNILLPSMSYILGLSLFGTAVLMNLFFGAHLGANDPGRAYIYEALLLAISAVAIWVGYRVDVGNQRDREGKYEVMYPGVSDYDELVAKEMPERAFVQLQEQIHDESSPKYRHVIQQHGNGSTQTKTLEIRLQAYAELLSLTHPHKLAVIGNHVSVDFFDFRDAASKLEAQIMLMSPPSVTQTATHMVERFVDCIVAKEEELRKEAERKDKRLDEAHVLSSREAFKRESDNLLQARIKFVHATQSELNQKASRLHRVKSVFVSARLGNNG